MITIEDNYSITYESCGLFISQCTWTHPKRIINNTEVILVLEGNPMIQEEETPYSLSKNDVLIISPGKLHFGFLPSEERVSFYWLHFTSDKHINLKQACYSDVYNLTNLFKTLLHVTNTPGYHPSSADLLTAMILNELEFLQSKQTLKISTLAVQIHEHIRNHVDKNLSVKQIADYFGYNENYIGKLFKKSYGIGIKKHIDNEKIKYAKNLLITTNFPIKQIAAMVGYSDENLFIKFFKYHQKISPAKCRNTCFNTHINYK